MEKLSKLIQVFLCFSLLGVFIIFMVLIRIFYKKYKKELQPVHIFQINLGVSLTVRILFFLGAAVLHSGRFTMMFPEFSENCSHYFIGLFIFIANELDTVIMQIDRMFAVYFSFVYKASVTKAKVVIVCLSSKVLAALFLTVAFFIDTNYSECVVFFGFFFTKPASVIFISFPQLLITSCVLVVSIILGHKIVKAKNSVAPVVTISYIAAVAEASRNVRIQRQDEELDMFYRTHQPDTLNKNTNSIFNEPGTKNALKVAKEALNATTL